MDAAELRRAAALSRRKRARQVLLDAEETVYGRVRVRALTADDDLALAYNAHMDELLGHIARALADAERGQRERDAQIAQHMAVYGNPRGKSHEYDRGWSDACEAVAGRLRRP